jgi:adenine-specific DNA-methyltransferase
MRGQMSNVRLELVWPNKDKFLLSPQGENGKPVWVVRQHPAAREVRLTEFTDAVGAVDDQHPERDNLLFVGDSLDALRILNESPAFRREYRGKVKLIYIDPPFNTGQAFEHYDDWMEHSTWLSFMRDRLLLMKELLTRDGSVWVHLDDAEHHRMRLLLDEVFGADGFVASVIWRSADTGNYDAKTFSVDHNSILIYSRTNQWKSNGLERNAQQASHYANPNNDPRGPWFDGNPLGSPNPRENLKYEIMSPTGFAIKPPPNGWRWSRETLKSKMESGEIRFNNEGTRIIYRTYLQEQKPLPPSTLWDETEETGSNRKAKNELKKLFGLSSKQVFDTPKPESLLSRVLTIATSPGDVVVDVFAGSGSTAAVSQKMNRRWITCEISADTVETFIRPRLKRVVEGQDQGGITAQELWLGGGGFRVVEIQDSFYVVTPLGIMLADDAGGPRYARAVAAQLGFDWGKPDGLLCGRRGRMRLAVLDGAVGIEEARQIVAELEENERVTIVARVILPGTEEWLAENSRGSICLKAPTDVLRERRKRRRVNGGDA